MAVADGRSTCAGTLSPSSGKDGCEHRESPGTLVDAFDRRYRDIHVYFWGKHNMDFMSEDMVKKFEKECPDPR